MNSFPSLTCYGDVWKDFNGNRSQFTLIYEFNTKRCIMLSSAHDRSMANNRLSCLHLLEAQLNCSCRLEQCGEPRKMTSWCPQGNHVYNFTRQDEEYISPTKNETQFCFRYVRTL